MTFSDAIKSGLPLTRKDKTWCYINYMSFFALSNPTYIYPNTFIDPDFFLSQIKLTKEDIIANDWIVKGFAPTDFETVE